LNHTFFVSESRLHSKLQITPGRGAADRAICHVGRNQIRIIEVNQVPGIEKIGLDFRTDGAGDLIIIELPKRQFALQFHYQAR
jgi:hypothetical protein